MKTRIPQLALCLCFSALIEAQVTAPDVGIVRYGDATVHAVYGVPANYIVDAATVGSADAVSFSDRGGLIAKDGRISLVDPALKTIAEYDSGESVPLVNVDGDLNSAVAWLPSRLAVLRWNGASFVLTEVNGASELTKVTSIHLDGPHTAKLLATNPDSSVSEATVSLPDGELRSLNVLPGVRGSAFRQHSFVVFHDQRGIEIATSTSIVRTLPLPASDVTGDLTFERMSSDSLHLISTSTKRSWVLHLGNSGASLFQLPEPPAHALSITAEEVQK